MRSPHSPILSCHYIAPVFTPRDSHRNINYSIIPDYVEFLLQSGVDGILIGGSAGNGVLQSGRERLLVVEAFVEAVRGRLAVIVHTGCGSLEDTQHLSDDVSLMAGVDAIMLSAPMFYPYTNTEGLMEYLSECAKSCRGKPLLYYHFPSLSHLDYNIVLLVRGMKECLPHFIGIKYTACDREEYNYLLEERIKIFLGFPNMIQYGAQKQGVNVSMITGPTNFLNGVMRAIVNLVLEGDNRKATVIQNDLDSFMKGIVVDGELMSGMLHIMDYTGLPMGVPTTPLSDLTVIQKKMIKRHLHSPASTQRYVDMIDTYTVHDKGFTPVSLSLVGIIGFIVVCMIRERRF